MKKKLSYELKEKLVEIGGGCFWLWSIYQSFFESCGVKRNIFLKYKDLCSNKYNVMRSILSYLEDSDDLDIIINIQANLFSLRSIPDKNIPDPEKAKQLLKELRDLCGEDLLEQKLKQQKIEDQRKARDSQIDDKLSYEQRLANLKNEFYEIVKLDNPQKRGFALEPLINKLFSLNEIEYHKSFRTETDQIDGYFKYDKFDYLVEIKWEKAPIDKGDLAEFQNEVVRRMQSTRGLFISMSGFNPNHISLFEGVNPRIILMDGEDLILILEGRFQLADALNLKIMHAVKNGKIFYRLRGL
jgi:hypothetical protein